MSVGERGSSPALLAFDLDGVLYSSEPFLAEAYREAIATVEVQHPGVFRRPTTSEIFAHIGWPLPVIFANLFPGADRHAQAALHAATLEVICRRVASGEGRLYADVPAVLQALRDAGYQLAIASNGRSRYVETVLTTYDLAALFAPRVSADQVGDKTAILHRTLADLGVAPAHAVMIGDRATDRAAARAVGCGFVGCDYGHGHRDEIAGAGPLVQRFADVPAAVAAVLAPPK